jgi:hypothetical protein
LIKTILARLEQEYEQPVDIEFAVSLTPQAGQPKIEFHLLQCRPQNQWGDESYEIQSIPTDLADEHKILLCTRMVPQGRVSQIEYIVYVDPQAYYHLDSLKDHSDIAHGIGQLNSELEGTNFILVGPGRWGSSDPMQGVPVTYADIFNSRALVEVASDKSGFKAEPSYGTHFFQDLVESKIYPLAVYPEEPGDHLNSDFLMQSKNQLEKFIPEPTSAQRCIKVIHIPSERPGCQMELIMDGQHGLGYLVRAKS